MMKVLMISIVLATLGFAEPLTVMPYVDFNSSKLIELKVIDGRDAELSTNPNFGYGFGLVTKIPLILELLNVRSGIEFQMLNSEVTDEDYRRKLKTIDRLQYLSIPILVTAERGPLYGGLGINFSYILSYKSQREFTSLSDSEDHWSDELDLKEWELYENFDYAIQFVVGYEFLAFEPGTLNLECYNNLGLINLYAVESEAFKEEIFSRSFGLRLGLALGI